VDAPLDPVALACAAVSRGEVVGLPTDTVYGLAIDPFRRESFAALYTAKRRPAEKPIPVLVTGLAQAEEIVEVSALGRGLIERHWPGGLTLVLSRRRDVPVHIGDPFTGTVAVRAPDHPVALRMLALCGPLAVTSANVSGEAAAVDAVEARSALGDTVAVYLEGEARAGLPSTVVDATGERPLVLRHGAVDIGGA